METETINAYSNELYRALRERSTVDPITERDPDITIEEAYRISLGLLKQREQDGERLIGKKIGITSKTVMQMLNVHQPDFGFLTDSMVFSNGEDIPLRQHLIQPRAEGEIAFVLKRDLEGPGVTAADVLRSTEGVMACFEVVDSRIRDWEIKIQDTVADNASCGVFVLGDQMVKPQDLVSCGMVVEKNGQVISTGAGAAALGSPVNCMVWLANTLGSLGVALKAGEIILSGSLVPLEPVKAGDFLRVQVGGIGSACMRFI